MALESADPRLIETVRSEVVRALQPLRDTIAEQEVVLERLTVAVWALEIANDVLRDLLPVARAEEVAQAVATALEAALPELRESPAGRELQTWRESLLEKHRYIEQTFPMLS